MQKVEKNIAKKTGKSKIKIMYKVLDERHREDGPAVIYPNGKKAYYLNGKKLTKKEFELKEKNIFKRSTIYYSNENGKLHRVDGPAVIHPDGSVQYWINDKNLTEAKYNKLIKAKHNKANSSK